MHLTVNRKTSQIPDMICFVFKILLAFVLGQGVATLAERQDTTWVSPAA